MSLSPTLFAGSGPIGLPPVPGLIRTLEVRHFSYDTEFIAAKETWLDGQNTDFFSGL
jgi:hypothetical protein